MAETLLSFGVERLWDLLVRESDLFQGVEEQFNELKSNLNLLRLFLKDADAKKHTNMMVKTCVAEIKEIVFDAEDLIESLLLKKELGQTSIMRRLSFIIVDRRKIASDIGDISKRISKVIRDMQSFGVQQMIVEGGEYSDPLKERYTEMRKTFPCDSENYLVGLEENVKKLVGYLVEQDSIQVVSITGMGGIGKTTLARQVFNHEMVKNHFDGVAWVCISQQFTRKYVWETILRQLSSKHVEHRDMTENELQYKLFRLLETSKFLIVLDDIWREEDWDIIKPVFPAKKGWKVLLTSRHERVALCADLTCVTFKPECLTIEESWTLFQRIAFRRKDTSDYTEEIYMEEMGKKMIKHCGGLPLAVTVLGSLLARQYTLSDWKRVYENIGSRILREISFNDSSVYHILYHSFEELPIYLKQCFLYFAHFPKDHPIRVRDLSYYWAAERIPRPRYYAGATIEEVGNVYIEELVKRNMVISERDVRTMRFETCRLHDMMREVCLFKAEEENFLQIVDASIFTSRASSQSPCISRRLSIHWSGDTTHMEEYIKNPKLRSLLIIKKQFSEIKCFTGLFFTRLQLLKVLDLSFAEFEGGKLPSSIGKLIHLRYLSLYQAHVTHLPSSMRNLKMLLYLNLTTVGSTYIPDFLNKMLELAYLSLPLIMHYKKKLELGNLVNLETLKNFSTENSCVRDLHRMIKLRNLSIYIRGEGCATETLSSSLSELRRLKNLTIFLEACRLVEDPMPILENLVQLKELNLGYKSYSGRHMVCSSSGFPQLQKLSIDGLKECEEWIIEEDSMCLLRTLDIRHCPKLKKLTTGWFSRLQELTIRELKEWEDWIVEEGSMPLLRILDIRHCPKLKKLPAGWFPQLQKLTIRGLREWEEWIVEEGSIPLLHTLDIRHCPKLRSFLLVGLLNCRSLL